MVVSIRDQLIESFRDDIIDMYLAGDHSFEAFELAFRLHQPCLGDLRMGRRLTLSKGLYGVLEV